MGAGANLIWINGSLVESEKATVHFLNSTLHYGIGVFEGIRCYETARGPAVFRLREHMERLIDSALILGYRNLPYSADELVQATREVIKANGFTQCYVRPLIFMDDGPTPTMVLDRGKAKVGIAAWYWGAYLGDEAAEKGVRANISSFTRHHINVSMTKAKVTGNYANSALAKTDSLRLGFDEAILLDSQGFVAECSGENIFVVRGKKIYTPPTTTILEGITRDAIITLLGDLGYTVIEQPISRDQLYIADEVFVCGTAAECVAVREVDFRVIGSGRMGPITAEIQKTYLSAVHGEHARSAGWLEYV
jgi:branched-chain amino acid aminotransferase